MRKLNDERVAAFSAAITEVYENIQSGKKTNFAELGRKHDLKSHAQWLKKALREKHLINEDCTKWNPAYTTPNEQLARSVYKLVREHVDKLTRESKARVGHCAHDEKYLTLDETVANVKHYGLFKIIMKCLFS